MTHEIVRTRSGALAVRSLLAGEVMHPGVGPLVEAERLYVGQSRLAERLRDGGRGAGIASSPPPLVVFDVGMGAASNAVAALVAAEQVPSGPASRLELISFESDLGALRLALTQAASFGLEGAWGAAARTLLAEGRHDTPRWSWILEQGDALAALRRQLRPADLVFWDPFSARVNPSLWTVAAFAEVRRQAGPRCTLFTYSSSTAARIAMLLGGWAVGAGDPIGDRQATTAAAVRVQDLTRPLDRGWLLAKVQRRGAPLPSDVPSAEADAVAALVAAAPQFHLR